jgi:bifunctional non-homologous end joining protein LigD
LICDSLLIFDSRFVIECKACGAFGLPESTINSQESTTNRLIEDREIKNVLMLRMARLEYDPQLATIVKSPPSGDRWVHEIKYDGYRIGCVISKDRVRLISRNGNNWTHTFPSIAQAARKLPTGDALIDGEVAMLLPDGRTSFAALQKAAAGNAPHASLVYFVFDLLRLDGERLDRLPLEKRKERLRALVGRQPTNRIHYAEHIIGDGEELLEHAARIGLEGIISKRRDLPYCPGRHDGWRKSKVRKRGPFVIGGVTDPKGTRQGISALLVGYYHGPRLVYAGRVGTGFSQSFALELRQRLDALAQRQCPFDPPILKGPERLAHWVKPLLVCDVLFAEWTNDTRLRAPVFAGLRTDVKPRDIKSPALKL